MMIEKRFKSYNDYLNFLYSFKRIEVLSRFDINKKEYVVLYEEGLK